MAPQDVRDRVLALSGQGLFLPAARELAAVLLRIDARRRAERACYPVPSDDLASTAQAVAPRAADSPARGLLPMLDCQAVVERFLLARESEVPGRACAGRAIFRTPVDGAAQVAGAEPAPEQIANANEAQSRRGSAATRRSFFSEATTR